MGRSPSSRLSATAGVQSVARAARILNALFASPDGKHLAELAPLIGVHKSTALRIMRTLEAEGLAFRDQERAHYTIAPTHWLQAAPTLCQARTFKAAAERILTELASGTGATAILFLPDLTRHSIAAVTWALPERFVRLDPAAGYPAAMHATAAGKCFLAGMTESELQQWVTEDLPRLTAGTITSPDDLVAEIAQVRELGYATNRQEAVSGTCGMAVPVLGDSGSSGHFAVEPP